MDRVIPASKSEMIRGLILKSWKPELKLIGMSESLDVENSREALRHFVEANPGAYYFGDSALGLRLWMARLSRKPGEYILEGSTRLLSRPHHELIRLLNELSVKVEIREDSYKVISNGWKIKGALNFDFTQSSQFASAILMNAWQLEQELKIELSFLPSYLKLTLETLRNAGLNFSLTDNVLTVPAWQNISQNIFEAQPDLSTAFTLAAWDLVQGRESLLLGFPLESYQPDYKFVQILKQMGARLEFQPHGLKISPSSLKGINVDLSETPDLFPVLSVLAGLSQGVSTLSGLKTLQWKESHRLKQGIKLLGLMNRRTSLQGDELIIHGQKFSSGDSETSFVFDPDEDHRFVMAAQTAKLAGFPIKILNPQAIKKTAPELLPEVTA